MANRKNTFLLKRSNVINKSPLLGDLQLGEIALNTADAKLYSSYTGGLTGATEIREIGWDRINRTGDTVTGDFVFYGDISISGSSLPNAYALSVTGDTNFFGNAVIQNGLTVNTIYTNYIDFNTTASTTTQFGRVNWDSGTGTLNIGIGDSTTGLIDFQVGQEEVVRVFNNESTTLQKGEIVYVSGSQGNRPAVKRAKATSDGYSVTTLGMVDSNISSGAEGYVTTFGIINNLNTLGLTGGTPIWLSGTVPGGFTSQKPIAPLHTVLIGYVIRVSATVGSVFVNISNGWELDELHDVRISGATEGDLLIRSSFSGTPVWVNSKTLNGNYTISGNTNQIGNFNITGDTTQLGNFDIAGNTFQLGNFDITGDMFQLGNSTQTGNVTLSGNTFITGNTTHIGNTSQLGNFNITGNTSQIGNTSQVGSFRIVSATTGCTFAVTGDTCLNGDLSIIGDTFMSGDFCMNNMNSNGLPTGTNCFDTTLIPSGTTVIHQLQGEGGILAHLGDLATGEPNSKGYVFMTNNTVATALPNTTNYIKITGTTSTIPEYLNLFTTGSSNNELVYVYPIATGLTVTYLKYNISHTSTASANGRRVTYALRKSPYPYTGSTTVPAEMTTYITGANQDVTGTLTGIVTAQHLDKFEAVAANTTGTGPGYNLIVSDFTMSLFT